MVFEDKTTFGRLNAEHRAKVNDILANAMGDYHDRFRRAVSEALREDQSAKALARNPERLAHLEQLVKALRGEDWEDTEE
jgi:uncharacterized membrane protein